MDSRTSFFFVVGAGRSGTTLMTGLLSAHSRLFVPPETHFLKRAAEAGDVNDRPAGLPSFWKNYIRSSRFLDLEVDPADCERQIVASGDGSFRGIFAAVLRCVGRNVGKPRIGEKTPAKRTVDHANATPAR